jgi:glycine/D-amino acid oxidase-like deaminating enzyme
MSGASVAVVGGGVIGASVACHLCLRGVGDIVVLDRGAGPGEGSTGRATGGFRAQFASAINVRLSLLAREKILRFGEEIGADPGYLAAGYLWLAGTEAELAELRAGRALQQAEGLHEAVEVDPGEIARLNPALRLDEVIGGTFCPTDGFIQPRRILDGYLAAARRRGARIEWETEVTGFTRRGDGRIATVQTSRGPIEVDVVVNAAGAWAAAVARMAGVDLPVTPLRRQVAITEPCDLLPATMPMTIFAGDGFHLRVRDGRVMLLRPTPGVPGQPFDVRVDPAWVDAVTETAQRRVPVLQRAVIDRAGCWAGLYEVSPDKHAILGPAPACANLFLINGSSGHGVMHAPALGQLLAEIICDGNASTLDVTALRPSRFDEGAPNPVSGLL